MANDVDPSRGQPDPLAWPGYDEARAAAREASGVDESVTVATEAFHDHPAVVVRWHFGHLGGSMGWAAGQRIAEAYDHAREERLPVVLRVSTGGARMQEGMASLVQMAATTVAARRHGEAGLLQVAVLGHPTTGGVFASHANLADVVWAVEGATIGFAGPRVAEALTGGALPSGSHTARGALAAGLVDGTVVEDDLDLLLAALLEWGQEAELVRRDGWRSRWQGDDVELASLVAPDPGDQDAWEAVLDSRDTDRARAARWIDGWEPLGDLRGDRAGGDDPALRVRLTRIHGAPVVVVALDRDVDDGRIGPAGYRKAWRAFDLAEKTGIPVVTLVDTKGADASASAEAGGIAHHIAQTFDRLLHLTVPTVALVTGEGGSGGALALAVCDRLLMLERSTFSVIAPEGAASILHRDPFRAPDVARQLKPDAATLFRLGIADAVITESGDPVLNGWHAIGHALADLTAQDAQQRLAARLAKWRTAPSPRAPDPTT